MFIDNDLNLIQTENSVIAIGKFMNSELLTFNMPHYLPLKKSPIG